VKLKMAMADLAKAIRKGNPQWQFAMVVRNGRSHSENDVQLLLWMRNA